MQKLIAALFLITICPWVLSQECADIHQSTTPPPGARFEIVQSELAARWTFRLDRFTGRVSQLVSTSDGGEAWQTMVVIDPPTNSATPHPRFQIFTSGLAAKHTFLLDADTGNTWVIVKSTTTNKDGKRAEDDVWEPFSY